MRLCKKLAWNVQNDGPIGLDTLLEYLSTDPIAFLRYHNIFVSIAPAIRISGVQAFPTPPCCYFPARQSNTWAHLPSECLSPASLKSHRAAGAQILRIKKSAENPGRTMNKIWKVVFHLAPVLDPLTRSGSAPHLGAPNGTAAF